MVGKDADMIMHKNILKSVKSAFVVLLTLLCLSFVFVNKASAQATNIATKTIQVNGQSYTVRVLESNKETKIPPLSEADSIQYMACPQIMVDYIYKSSCYPCKVVKSLVSVFLNGCKYLEGTSKEAGQKLLILGFMLWVAFYVMRQVSSFKNIEPASMVNDLLIMAFKILFAWVVIVRGYSLMVDYVLVPFLGWGVDFGTELVVAATTATGLDISGTQVESSYLLGPDYDGILPPHILNNIMTYIAAVDGTVTNHLKIGHMVMCHSTHAGAWGFPEYGLSIPNFWMWLCGAAIWIVGFCMTFSVLFYLVDMSFKLGFVLVALPIVTGLWPFGMTKGKLKACFDMLLHAAGTFIFLAMTTACGLVLVDSAIAVGQGIMENTITDSVVRAQGTQKVLDAIERGDTEATADMFSIFSSSFFILVFAYLYAIKVIGSTLSDYVDVFFGSDALGSPMHHRFTQSVAYAKEQIQKRLKRAKNLAKAGLKMVLMDPLGGASAALDDGEGGDEGLFDKVEKFNQKLTNLQKGKFNEEEGTKKESKADTAMSMTNMKAKDGDKMDKDAGIKGGKDDGSNAATQALEAAGEGLEQAGQSIKDAANAVQQTGKAVDAAGTAAAVPTLGTAKVATTAARVGTETSATATKLGAEALILAGKTLRKTAKLLKEFNKVAKRIQKVTKKVQKAAKKVQKGVQKVQKAVGGGSDENKENKNNQDQQNPIKNLTEGSDKQQMRENSEQDGLVGSMAKTAAGGNKDEK